jgi:hypothetical protein
VLEAALSASACLGHLGYAREFVAALHGLLRSQEGVVLEQNDDAPMRRSIRALRQLGLWQELQDLLSCQVCVGGRKSFSS